MFTVQDLLKMWVNNEARRAFIHNYKVWGVWFSQPELNLTYYKFDLPGGGQIIAMEYLREPYAGERLSGNIAPVVCTEFYLQFGKYFKPQSASESVIAEKLKELKMSLKQDSTEAVAA